MAQTSNGRPYHDRWALVTGASAGLGATYARHLARQGAHVVLVARREDRLAALADEIEAMGRKTLVIQADLSHIDAPGDILDRLDAAGISVDILVNNAGAGLPGGYTTLPWQAHQDYIQLMVASYGALAHGVLPGMKTNGWGRVINIASVAGLVPGGAGNAFYGAAKAFLINFSQSLAAEYADAGVHISACCPGFTNTEFFDVIGTRDQMNKIPSFAMLTADQVVQGSLDAVEKKNTVYVPGILYKGIVFLVRALPLGLAEFLTGKVLGKSERPKRP